MLSVNRKNYHLIQRIGIGLKIVEKCSIDRTRLIEYNQMKLYIKVFKLMNNGRKMNIQV